MYSPTGTCRSSTRPACPRIVMVTVQFSGGQTAALTTYISSRASSSSSSIQAGEIRQPARHYITSILTAESPNSTVITTQNRRRRRTNSFFAAAKFQLPIHRKLVLFRQAKVRAVRPVVTIGLAINMTFYWATLLCDCDAQVRYEYIRVRRLKYYTSWYDQ